MKKMFDWMTRRLVYHALVREGMNPKDASRKIIETKEMKK